MKLLSLDLNSTEVSAVIGIVWNYPAKLTDDQKNSIKSLMTTALDAWTEQQLSTRLDGLTSVENLEIEIGDSSWGPAKVKFYDTTR